MRYCPSCSFDLSSVLVKSKIEQPKAPKKQVVKEPSEDIEPQEVEQEPEQDAIIKKIASKLIIKPNGDVKKRPTEKQDSHLQKAREARAQKQAEKKAQKQQPKQQEPKPSNEHNYAPQEPMGYQPLFNIF